MAACNISSKTYQEIKNAVIEGIVTNTAITNPLSTISFKESFLYFLSLVNIANVLHGYKN